MPVMQDVEPTTAAAAPVASGDVRTLEVRRLGIVGYEDGLALQRSLVEDRRAGRTGDVLLLLQHPPVITLGVKGDGGRANIIATHARLAELGIVVHETGRGGEATYHCARDVLV